VCCSVAFVVLLCVVLLCGVVWWVRWCGVVVVCGGAVWCCACVWCAGVVYLLTQEKYNYFSHQVRNSKRGMEMSLEKRKEKPSQKRLGSVKL
jgi:hypothetical protein